MNAFQKLISRIKWRRRYPRAVIRGNVELGTRVFVGPGVELKARKDGERICIGSGTDVHCGTLIHCYEGTIHIGENVSVNPYCVLYGHGGLTIGNDVLIATGCVMVPANHVVDDPDIPIRLQGCRCRGIRIEDDVWIAAKVVILDGVTIGRGAVIGAGAVVTKDVPPGAIAVGVPARVMRFRDGYGTPRRKGDAALFESVS